MEWLNYHHLLYFWLVAREGGLAPAGRLLGLAHSTLSAQIHALEDRLGERLFERQGRRLALTEMGRLVYRYADEIFRLGGEMLETVKGRPTGRPLRLDVGVADVVPKLVVRRLLAPAFRLPEAVRVTCHEGSQPRLLADLALHTLDVVIADAPVPPGSPVKAYTHPLGESGVTFFAVRRLAAVRRRRFPASLDGCPVLLPMEGAPLRRALDLWFDRRGVRPTIVAEFADSALLQQVASDGLGVFAAPSVVEREVTRQYGVEVVGRTGEVKERFYAISAERRLAHPGVVALCDGARASLFGAPRAGRRARRS